MRERSHTGFARLLFLLGLEGGLRGLGSVRIVYRLGNTENDEVVMPASAVPLHCHSSHYPSHCDQIPQCTKRPSSDMQGDPKGAGDTETRDSATWFLTPTLLC